MGWLDLVALKYAVEVNGITGIALMKADILNNQKSLKVCTQYRLRGTRIDVLPSSGEDMDAIEPIYETWDGWGHYNSSKTKSFSQLPEGLVSYVKKIESFLGVPIVLVSIGPQRDETIEVTNPFG